MRKMMYLLYVLLSLSLLSGCMTDWNKRDRILLGTYILSQGIDIYQTDRNLERGRSDINPLVDESEDLFVVKGIGMTAVMLLSSMFPEIRVYILELNNVVGWGSVGLNLEER